MIIYCFANAVLEKVIETELVSTIKRIFEITKMQHSNLYTI